MLASRCLCGIRLPLLLAALCALFCQAHATLVDNYEVCDPCKDNVLYDEQDDSFTSAQELLAWRESAAAAGDGDGGVAAAAAVAAATTREVPPPFAFEYPDDNEFRLLVNLCEVRHNATASNSTNGTHDDENDSIVLFFYKVSPVELLRHSQNVSLYGSTSSLDVARVDARLTRVVEPLYSFTIPEIEEFMQSTPQEYFDAVDAYGARAGRRVRVGRFTGWSARDPLTPMARGGFVLTTVASLRVEDMDDISAFRMTDYRCVLRLFDAAGVNYGGWVSRGNCSRIALLDDELVADAERVRFVANAPLAVITLSLVDGKVLSEVPLQDEALRQAQRDPRDLPGFRVLGMSGTLLALRVRMRSCVPHRFRVFFYDTRTGEELFGREDSDNALDSGAHVLRAENQTSLSAQVYRGVRRGNALSIEQFWTCTSWAENNHTDLPGCPVCVERDNYRFGLVHFGCDGRHTVHPFRGDMQGGAASAFGEGMAALYFAKYGGATLHMSLYSARGTFIQEIEFDTLRDMRSVEATVLTRSGDLVVGVSNLLTLGFRLVRMRFPRPVQKQCSQRLDYLRPLLYSSDTQNTSSTAAPPLPPPIGSQPGASESSESEEGSVGARATFSQLIRTAAREAAALLAAVDSLDERRDAYKQWKARIAAKQSEYEAHCSTAQLSSLHEERIIRGADYIVRDARDCVGAVRSIFHDTKVRGKEQFWRTMESSSSSSSTL